MTSQKKYRFDLEKNCIRIFTRSGAEIGTLDLPCQEYPVRACDGEKIGVVNLIEDALPFLLNHWEQERRR